LSEVQRRPRLPHRHLINAGDAVLYLKRAHGVEVKATTIRQWASRRHIGSHGYRRERYDLREIVAYVILRGIIPNPESPRNGDSA
jgi:hypothetical protein